MKNLTYNQRGFLVILGVIAVIFIISLVDKQINSPNNSSSNQTDNIPGMYDETKPLGTKGGAYVAAKKFIKQRLKAPSTAKFESVTKCKITDVGNNIFYVHIKVDAQNSYGAMIRKTFSVEVECTGEDYWKCNEIQEY